LLVGEVLGWCRANDIPAIHRFQASSGHWIGKGRHFWVKFDDAMTAPKDNDTLVVRECDYELVRLRF
jgi:hypothetical protein